ncbi:MAG: alpha-ribazole phosphatase [Prevotella sp.]
MDIIMVRHTRVGVEKGTCYGWSDVPVADTFEEEAKQTKARLDTLFADGMPDNVYSSPLTRARKLAAFCGFDSPELDERLKEMNMGDWEMKRYDEIKDDALQMWYDDYMHLRATNGEGFPDLYSRVSNFLDELKEKKYRRVAIFAHGGVLLCAGIYAGLFPEEGCFSHLVECGGVQRLHI